MEKYNVVLLSQKEHKIKHINRLSITILLYNCVESPKNSAFFHFQNIEHDKNDNNNNNYNKKTMLKDFLW